MDENAKRMMEQLKADPAALRQLMQSRDGQALMQALTRPDNGAGLQRAMQAAMRGDTNVMAELVGRVLLRAVAVPLFQDLLTLVTALMSGQEAGG